MKKSRLAKQLLAALVCGAFMAMNGDVSLANAAPVPSKAPAASKAYSFNDRQGGARGFIVKRVWGVHRYFVSL